MYEKIKQLADEAVALQNKDRMDAALREISGLCHPDVQRQLADAKALESATSGFGLAHVKMEGCAIHPDDVDAAISVDQYAKQLAAHEADVAAGKPAGKPAPKAKKASAK